LITSQHVGLFITCLTDLFRPSVGFASVKLLRDAGCRVTVPRNQTCCGQPAYNSGDRASAQKIAKMVIEEFEPFDYVVAPSASCAAMLSKHYKTLFTDDLWIRRSHALAAKTYEIVSFLYDVCEYEVHDITFNETVTYHDSCSALRELHIKDQPRHLLAGIDGLKLEELDEAETCCGFGGTFCVKYPEISGEMVGRKTAAITATNATTVLSSDLGCLLNIAGKIHRDGLKIKTRHITEILSGSLNKAAIGDPPTKI
jgi:L-lactate dehydrogenase complex protein LldE